jgi:hypothetical protein
MKVKYHLVCPGRAGQYKDAFKETRCEDAVWIRLDQNGCQWRALVSMVMNILASSNYGNFLIACYLLKNNYAAEAGRPISLQHKMY